MKFRWLSRGSVALVALVSSFGVAACSRAASSGTEATDTPEAAPAAAARPQAKHGPGYKLFRQIEALDLEQDQREAVLDIEADLTEDLSAHKETVRQVAETLSHGIEAGALDEAEAARNQEALGAAAIAIRADVISAMNEVHAVLDADQREELVLSLRAQRDAWRAERAGREPGDPGEGLAKVAVSLGISTQQMQMLRTEVHARMDDLFPDRKARREAWDARMEALGDAFLEDDFDAATLDLGADTDQVISSFTTAAKQAIAVSARVLLPSQRAAVASLLRARAAEL